MDADRRFSEAELHAIFERAARRQEAARQAEDAAHSGMTLAELQAVGRAAGIAPDHVAAAAREVAEPAPAVGTMFGVPTEVRRTRVLPGLVTDEAWERMVAELRRQFRSPGTAGQVGRRREWAAGSSSHAQAGPRVTLEPAGGDTRVTIEKSLRSDLAGMHVGGLMFLVFAALVAALGITWVLPLLFALAGVGMLGGTQLGFRQHARSLTGRYEAVLDRLELIARDAAPPPLAASERAPMGDPPPLRIEDEAPPESEGVRPPPLRSRS